MSCLKALCSLVPSWHAVCCPPACGWLLSAQRCHSPPLLCSQPESIRFSDAVQWPDTVCCHAAPALLADKPNCHAASAPHSQKPFNGETPHALLAGAFVTPADIHFVRNHMPVPHGLSAAEHRWGAGWPDRWETPVLREGLLLMGAPGRSTAAAAQRRLHSCSACPCALPTTACPCALSLRAPAPALSLPAFCSITIEAPGVGSTTLTLQDIRTKFKSHTFCSVLQWLVLLCCAALVCAVLYCANLWSCTARRYELSQHVSVCQASCLLHAQVSPAAAAASRSAQRAMPHSGCLLPMHACLQRWQPTVGDGIVQAGGRAGSLGEQTASVLQASISERTFAGQHCSG